jgi:hypothetical protein
MCLSCGCGKAHDDHGDERHITLERLEEAADAAGIPPVEAAQNIQAGVEAEYAEPAEMES